MMKIKELLEGEIVKLHRLTGEESITDIYCNSREVTPGSLFFAIKGTRNDGYNFIDDAMRNGAVAGVVYELRDEDIPQVVVKNVSRAFGISASRLFNEPSKKMRVIGVTGTNGKTTITYMIESVLKEAGIPAGIIGTTGYRYKDMTFPSDLTTPDAKKLNSVLNEMLSHRTGTVAMEVSSHALELGRVWGIDFDVAVFTNLTRDHLDFHGSMENYFKAKEKLFSVYLPASQKDRLYAVVNNDTEYSRRIIPGDPRIRRITYGVNEGADIRVVNMELHPSHSIVDLQMNHTKTKLRINLTGRHNIYNALACTGVASVLDIDIKHIKAGLENLVAVPGRLEPVRNNRGIRILIDYAHSPDALENVIRALKETGNGRLITIFGCGGDRDRGKRPLMGEVAGRNSDITIITSDNPRTEDPASIIKEIEQGIVSTGAKGVTPEELFYCSTGAYTTLVDRKVAIGLGLRIAQKGDTLLIAGKGHEDYQIIGTKKIHFSDREVVEELLKENKQDAVRANNK